MTREKEKRRHRVWLIVVSCAALAAGIFLLIRSFPEDTLDWEPETVYLLVDEDFDATSVEQLLDAYCNYRADSMRQTKTAAVRGEDLLSGAASLPRGSKAVRLAALFSPDVIAEEERRQGLISDMEWSTMRKMVNCSWEISMDSQQGSGALIYLKCNFKTIYEYAPFSAGTPDEENLLRDEFTTPHTITLQQDDNGYRLIADAYAEEPTGMRSSSYMDTTR